MPPAPPPAPIQPPGEGTPAAITCSSRGTLMRSCTQSDASDNAEHHESCRWCVVRCNGKSVTWAPPPLLLRPPPTLIRTSRNARRNQSCADLCFTAILFLKILPCRARDEHMRTHRHHLTAAAVNLLALMMTVHSRPFVEQQLPGAIDCGGHISSKEDCVYCGGTWSTAGNVCFPSDHMPTPPPSPPSPPPRPLSPHAITQTPSPPQWTPPAVNCDQNNLSRQECALCGGIWDDNWCSSWIYPPPPQPTSPPPCCSSPLECTC